MEAVTLARPRTVRRQGPNLQLKDVAKMLGFRNQWVQDLVNVPVDHPDALVAYYNEDGVWKVKPPEKHVKPLFFYPEDVKAWLEAHPPKQVEPISYTPEEAAVALEAVHNAWYQDELGNSYPILQDGLVNRKALIQYLDKHHRWRSGDYPKMKQILNDAGFTSPREKKPDRRHVYRKGLHKV